jgi:hypothetical protein
MNQAEKRSIRYERNAAIRPLAGSVFMNFTISCPSCERNLRVPPSLLGQAVKCPNCSTDFTAPEGVEEDVPRRPAPPPEQDFDEEIPRPSKRPSRRDELDDDDYDEEPRPRRRREKPGKVQAIAILVLIGGIFATLTGASLLIVGAASCVGLLWPGTYYALVLGIMAIIRGANLLGDQAYKHDPPYGIANMMIINIINCDALNLTLGILVLVFLGDEEVKRYFRR